MYLTMGMKFQGELWQQQIHTGKKIQNLSSNFFSEKLLELPSTVGIREFSNCPYWEFLGKESLPFILSLSIVLDT